MLTKAQIKHIRSLGQQKYRYQYREFIAEGDKIAREWLVGNNPVAHIVCLEAWASQHHYLIANHPEASVAIVPPQVLESVSQLHTPHEVLLVVRMPDLSASLPVSEWSLVLDDIQDPGNMGTLIRIADWFGIRHIVCSPGCVDVFNPKVVQAAMGGHIRVAVHEADLKDFLQQVEVPKLAATLEGSSVYHCERLAAAALMIGNESKGLHPDLLALADLQVTIPRTGGAESLNAAVSAGILCALLRPLQAG